jgi:hypothetical protein
MATVSSEGGRLRRSAVAAGPLPWLALGLLGLSLASALVVAPVPTYDPWMWLLWGREVAAGGLSTAEGPAFKPLPVAVCAALAPIGAAAPALWVLLARAVALAGVWLAFRLGRRLGGDSVAAGGLAAAGVALCGGFLVYAATGLTEGALVALALGGAEAWRAGRGRIALACAVACALLRVETWPFLLVAAVVHCRRRPRDAPLLAGVAAAVVAAWFVPEWLGSGDPLRSGGRALVPNPGQPALAAVPALASVGLAIALPLWPLWLGVAWLAARAARGSATARRALGPAGVGGLWIALVAAMAQAGFSGEPRYALPGAALVAISGAVGLVDAARWCGSRGDHRAWGPGYRPSRIAATAPAVALVALLALAAAPRLADLPRLRAAQAYQAALADDLSDAVEAAGGRAAVLACGRPYVGRYRGPLMAYELRVAKRVVGFAPRPPGALFRSRLSARSRPEPDAPAPFAPAASAGRWQVLLAC